MTDDTVEVLDATGDRVDVGEAEHPDGDRAAVAASLPDLDDGAYVVAWRVVSSDSHPISGAFTFRGRRRRGSVAVDDQALIDDVLGGSQDGDHTLGAVYGVVRFLAFGGLTVLVGSVVFLAWLWPGGPATAGPAAWCGAPGSVSVVATVLCIPLQAAYATGGTLGDACRPGRRRRRARHAHRALVGGAPGAAGRGGGGPAPAGPARGAPGPGRGRRPADWRCWSP